MARESHAWIAPDGAWHPCGHGEHDALADRLHAGGTPALESAGYLRLHGDGHIACRDGWRPTRRQLDTLADIAQASADGPFRRGVLRTVAEAGDTPVKIAERTPA